MAYGVMAAARRHGLTVPDDLSIVGIDDHEVAAAWDLTTVAQPVDTLGELAAWQIAARLNGDEGGKVHQLVVPTSLIIRNSTMHWGRA
jgi:DNA-binding LacI/PurR family transcriptional regulator